MSKSVGEPEVGALRCSSRKTRGRMPERYGQWQYPLQRNGSLPVASIPAEDDLDNRLRQLLDVPHSETATWVSENFYGQESQARSKAGSSCHTTSSQKNRRRIDAEMKAANEIAQLQAEADELELQSKLKAIEEKKKAVDRRLQMEKFILEENSEEENIPDDQSRWGKTLSLQRAMSTKEKVDSWRKSTPHQGSNSNENDILGAGTSLQKKETSRDDFGKMPILSLDQLAKIIQNLEKPSEKSGMEKILARQTTGKELPHFSGDPEEWPKFVAQFRRSTELCGFSNEENMYRLQKSLRGKAKEAVLSMMIVPENLDKVIKTLEITFGRPEYIIKVLVEKARRLPYFKPGQFEKLIEFSNVVRNLVTTMESLKAIGHLYNPQLMEELVGKLPDHLRLRWGEIVFEKTEAVSLKDFSSWIEKISNGASCVSMPYYTMEEKHHENRNFDRNRKPGNRKEVLMATSNEKKFYCSFCRKESHSIEKCKEFTKESEDSRWAFITEKKLRFSCLRSGHQTIKCRSKKVCGENGCDLPHHKLLHRTENRMLENVNTTFLTEKTILLMVIPVVLRGPKGKINTFALFDDASTVTMLDSSVAKQIGARGFKDPLHLKWANSCTKTEEDSFRTTVYIRGINDENEFIMENVATTKELDLPMHSVDCKKLSEKWKYLQHIPIASMKNVKPTILIGLDNIHLTVAREIVEGPRNGPVAARTKLGWTLLGNVNPLKSRIEPELSFCTFNKQTQDEMIHELVKESWKTESFGVSVNNEPHFSSEDIRAMKIMDETTLRIGNKFEIGLLWKEDNPVMPESKKQAFSRLLGQERKMDKDAKVAKDYCEKIEQYVEKGFARKLSKKEAEKENSRTWYLCHFGVVNPNKPGIRLVFDAAARNHGKSFNDHFIKGPDLLQPLPAVLYKFRQKSVVFSGDIQDMFHMVSIREEDQFSQRFLWRGMDRNRKPDVYAMQVMIFGGVSSPYQAQEIKNRNAREHKDEFPEATKAIIERHYMDDYLDSTHTEKEAIDLINQVIEVHKRGGFTIRKWLCSSKEVLKQIPEELRADSTKDINLESELAVERVLGLYWDPNEDTFSFKCKFNRVDKDIVNGLRRPTKREVLRMVMSIFDPLGFVSHFTVKAKILLQEIWRVGIGWDDQLTEILDEKWKLWLTELKSISDLKIPRCYSMNMKVAISIQLHTFCDASEKAFSAVSYIRVDTGEEVNTSFIAAKNRVSPLRPMSIPRLELQAAVMASRLAKSIIENHDVKFADVYFWSDSKTVLSWLNSDARNYKPFVSHRVGEILELTNVEDWNWISTHINVADESTRDNKLCDFNAGCRWFTGSNFLLENKEKWPINKMLPIDCPLEDLERKKEFVNAIFSGQGFLPDAMCLQRFPTWTKILRIVAWRIRYVFNLLAKIRKSPIKLTELLCDELRKAERLLLLRSQEENFGLEMQLLKIGKEVGKSSRIYALSPFIDECGMLRMRSRISRTICIGDETKYPLILDPQNVVTKLLVNHYHVQAGHNGLEFVFNEMRQKYWILTMRSAIRSAWNNCQICKIKRTKPEVPEMGMIPEDRLQANVKPFTIVGVDYFGPISVTIGRRHEKRYGVLFMCMTTRAIHLEIAHSLSTDSNIMAIQRMISRRGFPEKIYSDNGTNLRGANNEIKKSLKDLDESKIISHFSTKGIDWHFIPPSGPNFAGSWERLVKSVKTALSTTLKSRHPKEEILQTLFAEAEATVNGRPLTHVSVDPHDPESLTPNHFLMGTSNVAAFRGTLGEFSDVDLCLRKQWRVAQRLADHFWKRWIREYLPTLSRRTKWHERKKNVEPGDLVFIADGNLKRNCWPRGIITTVYPGKDGIVRVVDVKTAFGVYRRPVSKVCVLDVGKIDGGKNGQFFHGGEKCA